MYMRILHIRICTYMLYGQNKNQQEKKRSKFTVCRNAFKIKKKYTLISFWNSLFFSQITLRWKNFLDSLCSKCGEHFKDIKSKLFKCKWVSSLTCTLLSISVVEFSVSDILTLGFVFSRFLFTQIWFPSQFRRKYRSFFSLSLPRS